MNVLKPSRNNFVVAWVVIVWQLVCAVGTIINIREAGLWGVLYLVAVVPLTVALALSEIRKFRREWKHYVGDRGRIDEHLALREEIIANLRLAVAKLQSSPDNPGTYRDGKGLRIFKYWGRFVCWLDTSSELDYDLWADEGSYYFTLRKYNIPTLKRCSVHVQYDGARTAIQAGEVQEFDWAASDDDHSWKYSPDSVASNDELRELLEHIKTQSLA